MENLIRNLRLAKNRTICLFPAQKKIMSMFCFSSKVAVLNDLLISICLQELRMYNPKYLERPYVVVLNKIDLPKVQFHS